MQTFQEQRDEERLDGAQRVNAEEVKLNDMKSQAHKVEANIRESTQNMIQSILADSALEVQRVEDNNESFFLCECLHFSSLLIYQIVVSAPFSLFYEIKDCHGSTNANRG